MFCVKQVHVTMGCLTPFDKGCTDHLLSPDVDADVSVFR